MNIQKVLITVTLAVGATATSPILSMQSDGKPQSLGPQAQQMQEFAKQKTNKPSALRNVREKCANAKDFCQDSCDAVFIPAGKTATLCCLSLLIPSVHSVGNALEKLRAKIDPTPSRFNKKTQ